MWKEAMRIDGGAIDDDHRRLFELINDLEGARDESYSRTKIVSSLRKLEHYTSYHFFKEEATMRQIGYEAIANHVEAHARLVKLMQDTVAIFEQEDNQTQQDAFVQKLALLPNAWIVGHIMKYDMPLRGAIEIQRHTKR